MVGRPRNTLFVEGGGDDSTLKTKCRRGFKSLLENAGFEGNRLRVVASGSRNNAYEQFCTALKERPQDDVAILLVDSEGPIKDGSTPWNHVKNQSGGSWNKPAGANDEDLHFMVECMENWFLADRDALSDFFGPKFNVKKLPSNTKVEEISKNDIHESLKKETRDSKKGSYSKGNHSFEILASLNSSKIRDAAPYANRFFNRLKHVLRKARPT